jgi:hypothetical protein
LVKNKKRKTKEKKKTKNNQKRKIIYSNVLLLLGGWEKNMMGLGVVGITHCRLYIVFIFSLKYII